MMVDVTMSMDEYMALIGNLAKDPGVTATAADNQGMNETVKPKKRSSAYQRRYKAAFRKLAPKYKLKSGKWKKGGFRTAVRLAHKEARK